MKEHNKNIKENYCIFSIGSDAALSSLQAFSGLVPSTFIYSYLIDKKPGVKSLGQGLKGRNEVRLGWEPGQTSKAHLLNQLVVF